MRIQNHHNTPPTRPTLPKPQPQGPQTQLDRVDLPNPVPQVYGAVGAMAGALLVGRPLASLAVAAAAGAVGGAVLGPIGAVAGAALGLYGGIKLELKTKAGRLVGGMLGGAVGVLAGKAAQLLGAQASPEMAEECKGFSLSSLPKKLLNPHYTSHKFPSAATVEEAAAVARPGDLIITNDDGNFMFEIGQKAAGVVQKLGEKLGLSEKGDGVRADWTHIYTVDHNHTVIDILLEGGGPSRFPLEFAFTDNTHAKIMRPNYRSEQAKEDYLAWMGTKFGKVSYDTKFDLKSDDAYYCQEYVYKGLEATNPDLGLKPSDVGIGPIKRAMVTADSFDQNPNFKEVWSTGSNFWMNWLSHFD